MNQLIHGVKTWVSVCNDTVCCVSGGSETQNVIYEHEVNVVIQLLATVKRFTELDPCLQTIGGIVSKETIESGQSLVQRSFSSCQMTFLSCYFVQLLVHIIFISLCTKIRFTRLCALSVMVRLRDVQRMTVVW